MGSAHNAAVPARSGARPAAGLAGGLASEVTDEARQVDGDLPLPPVPLVARLAAPDVGDAGDVLLAQQLAEGDGLLDAALLVGPAAAHEGEVSVAAQALEVLAAQAGDEGERVVEVELGVVVLAGSARWSGSGRSCTAPDGRSRGT